MKSIVNDIKSGNFKNIYLLYGEEVYLKINYKNMLLKALVSEGDTMNYNAFEGKAIEISEIISLAETLPFFADYRTILIENSGFFKNSADELAEYFKGEYADTTRFIFVESQVDKRNKLYKAVSSKGTVVEFASQTEETLIAFIAKVLNQGNLKITGGNASYLLSRTGNDMSQIKGELDKLISYCYGREAVNKEDIDAVVTRKPVSHVFDMIDAIAQRQQTRALDMYYELLALRESHLGILALLVRHFNILLQVRDLKERGYDNKDLAKKLAINAYFIGKYVSQAGKFTRKTLISILENCADTEDKIKKGLLQDKVAIEMLICRYSA